MGVGTRRVLTAVLLLTLGAASGSFPAAQTGQAPVDPVPGPDSQVQPGTPVGEVIKAEFAGSQVYPGTWREYRVYIPQQLDRAKPSPVMVFQDGLQYHAPVVFDNLIHRREIPPMVGVFVMHGRVRALSPDALDRMNRSFEYDAVSSDYARFLLDEMLPHVAKTHGLTLSTDPNDRAIAGNSSGAIAAFVAAWQRPDAFRRVFSAIGTYVGLRGGHEFPVLIRKTEPKPIRVFLQDGSNDLNNYTGSWWIANQDMLSALQYAGYDVRHEWGDGAHNSRHAAAIFPDALRWLWRGYPAPVTANPDGKSGQDVWQTLIPGEEWQLVSQGHRHTDGPAVNARGELFFSDPGGNRIHRVGLDGTTTIVAENTSGANGMMFGPDGRLYAGATRSRQLVAYGPDGQADVIAQDVLINDLAVNVKGEIYFTDSPGRKVWFIPKGGAPRVVDEGIEYQIQPDGSLAHKQRYFHLHMAESATRSGGDGMTVDADGRVYIATALGVQVFDRIGKAPQAASLSSVKFGGPNLDEMYVTNGDKVFKRRTRVKGVVSWRAPVTPAAPRL